MRRGLLWTAVLVLSPAPSATAQEEDVTPAGGFGRRAAASECCPPVQGWPVYPDIPSVTPPGTPPEMGPPAPAVGDQLADRFATAFATQTGQGGLQGRSVNEESDGDNAGMFYRLRVVTGTMFERRQVGTATRVVIGRNGEPRTITVPVFANVPVTQTRTVRVPVAGRYSGVQVSENDSPRPSDRVYFGFNYYDGIAASLNPGFGDFTQYRSMVGFEKTLLDGSASVGMRIPFIQMTGPAGLGGDSVGDLTVLMKYAVVNDYERMNYFTLGFAVTAPTGAAGGTLADGSPIPHSVLLQPWVGFVRSRERAYLQGITNVIVPTDDRDIVLMGNSFAVGYWLYRGNADRLLPAVTPTAEAHIRTPLSNRGPDELVYFPDQVNITSGVHFRWPRAVLSGALCVPVVGPRPWNVEAIFHANLRF